MDTADFWQDVLVIVLLIFFNGILALSEAAMLSVRKARLQQRINDGEKKARLALKLAENPNRFLSTIQIGITLLWLSAIMTLYTGWDYLRAGMRYMIDE